MNFKGKKIRRRVITETKHVALVVDSVAHSDLQCEFCGEASAMISPLLAAKLSHISTREIYRLIETGKVHFIELADRQMFVCLSSLKGIELQQKQKATAK